MKKFKKVAALVLAMLMVVGMLAGCSKDDNKDGTKESTKEGTVENTKDTKEEDTSKDDQSAEGGKVYFLNFKPESATIWEEIMKVYTEETGVEATVMTAAAGSYESTLKSEMAKTDAPTLFQINGPVGYESWKDYCMDLSDTDFYSYLSDKSLAVTSGDGVYGIPYAIEGYGIIYNKAILKAYCELDGAVISSVEDIKNFDTFKSVVEDIQAKKDELGIEGAFASTSFASGEDWRWQTHLANLPLYYEYKDKGVTDADTIEGKYLDNYKAIFDLYINNSCTSAGLLSSKTVADSMAEFALGQVAFTQNGDWAWGDIKDNEVAAEDVAFLPIYIGVDGEENQGLCIGTENFWCVNEKASEADKKATLDFINWLLTSEKGKNYMISELGFTAPFTTFGEDETPSNPLCESILAIAAEGKTSVSWSFNTMPSQKFKNDLGAALLEYAQGTGTWDGVVSAFVDGWSAEKANPTPEGAE